MTIAMNTDTKSALRYKNVNICRRNFSLHDISVFLTTEISCIQYLDTINFNNKHGSPNYMTCYIWCYFYSLLLNFNSKFNFTNSCKRLLNMILSEQNFLLVSDFKSIFNQVIIDVLCWLCHINLFLIVIFVQKIWQSPTMIKMSMSDNNH